MARVDDEVVTVPRLSSSPAILGAPQLDGVSYQTRFLFNVRDRRWYLSVLTAAGAPIVEGIRITSGSSLLAPWDGDPRLPPGQLYVEDADGLGRAPDRTAWQGWATLYYRPAAVRALAVGTADEVL